MTRKEQIAKAYKLYDPDHDEVSFEIFCDGVEWADANPRKHDKLVCESIIENLESKLQTALDAIEKYKKLTLDQEVRILDLIAMIVRMREENIAD